MKLLIIFALVAVVSLRKLNLRVWQVKVSKNLWISQAYADFKVATGADLAKYRDQCKADLSLSDETLEQFKKWTFTDEKSACYIECVFKYMDLFGADGYKVSFSKILLRILLKWFFLDSLTTSTNNWNMETQTSIRLPSKSALTAPSPTTVNKPSQDSNASAKPACRSSKPVWTKWYEKNFHWSRKFSNKTKVQCTENLFFY